MGVCCQLESSKNLKVIISEHKNVNTVHGVIPSQIKKKHSFMTITMEGEALLLVFFFGLFCVFLFCFCFFVL